MILTVFRKNLAFFLILFATLILRLPSLLEPFWYGDEGVYMALGQAMLKGLPLYSEAFDNKPPGIYLLSAFSMLVFGHTIWSLRFLLLIWVLISQVVIYFLAIRLWDSRKAGLVAAAIFGLLTATPLIEGNIANGEIFFILFTTLGFLYGLKNKPLLSGVSFALAVLIKAPAVFDFLAFVPVLLLHQRNDNLEKTSARIIKLGIGFALPLGLTALYFLITGHFRDFYFSVLTSNVGYTDYGNRFLGIPNGLLLIKAMVIGGIGIWFFRDVYRSWHKKLEEKQLTTSILILWLFFSLYGTLFGGRDFSHYLIQLVPAVSLLITGLALKRVESKKTLLALGAVLAIVSFFGFRPDYFKWSYYPNAVSYFIGKMDQQDFNQTFDRKVSRNYTLGEVAKRLSDKNDTMFIWANEPQIYFLADRANAHRYTAAYHVNNYQGYQDVIEKLTKAPPKIIITEKPYPYSFPELEDFIKSYYSLSGEFDDAEVYSLNAAF